MRIFFTAALLFIILASSSDLIAQGESSDYDRANSLKTLFKDKAFGITTDIVWGKVTDQILYGVSTTYGKQFMLANITRREKKTRF